MWRGGLKYFGQELACEIPSVASRQQTLHAICSVRHLQRLHSTTPLVRSSLVQCESSISTVGKRFELPSLRSGAWCLARFADISIRRDVFYLEREIKGRGHWANLPDSKSNYVLPVCLFAPLAFPSFCLSLRFTLSFIISFARPFTLSFILSSPLLCSQNRSPASSLLLCSLLQLTYSSSSFAVKVCLVVLMISTTWRVDGICPRIHVGLVPHQSQTDLDDEFRRMPSADALESVQVDSESNEVY